MLFDYLATHYRYLYRDRSRTFFQGVFQVPPACCIRFSAQNKTVERYWMLEPAPESVHSSPDEAAEELGFLVRDAVARRLDPDRGLGFSLSSGMDSSSVVGLACQVMGRKADIYSVGYGSGEYDESAGAAPAAEKFGRTWNNILLSDPDLFDELTTC